MMHLKWRRCGGVKRLGAVMTVIMAVMGIHAGIRTTSAQAAYECPGPYLCVYKDANGYQRGGYYAIGANGHYPRMDYWVGAVGGDNWWFDNSISSLYNRSPYRFCAYSSPYFIGTFGGTYLIRPGDVGNMNPWWYWNDKISSLRRC
jgi:hypothetical protein